VLVMVAQEALAGTMLGMVHLEHLDMVTDMVTATAILDTVMVDLIHHLLLLEDFGVEWPLVDFCPIFLGQEDMAAIVDMVAMVDMVVWVVMEIMVEVSGLALTVVHLLVLHLGLVGLELQLEQQLALEVREDVK